MISDNNLKKRIQNHLIQIYGDIHSSDEIYSIADNLTSFLSEQHELLETKKVSMTLTDGQKKVFC